jgi:hypothetical protein
MAAIGEPAQVVPENHLFLEVPEPFPEPAGQPGRLGVGGDIGTEPGERILGQNQPGHGVRRGVAAEKDGRNAAQGMPDEIQGARAQSGRVAKMVDQGPQTPGRGLQGMIQGQR